MDKKAPRLTLFNAIACWLFGHKWDGQRRYCANGDFEICSRCAKRGETVYYAEDWLALDKGLAVESQERQLLSKAKGE